MKIHTTFVIFAIAITQMLFLKASHSQEQVHASTARKAIDPGKHFSTAIEAGDYVFLSGAVGTDAQNKVIPGGVKMEVHHIMAQFEQTLARSGLSLKDIVKTTVYLRHGKDFAAMNAVYQSYFPNDPPARTTVVVGFPDKTLNVEIDAIAYRSPMSRIKTPAVIMHASAPPPLHALEALPAEQLSELITRQYLHGTQSTFVRWEMKKGAVIPMHQHPNEQVTWITKGRAEVEVGGKQYVMQAGDMIIIPPDVPHKFVFTEDTVDIDFFSPARQDWIDGSASYLPQ
ncbi:Rid family hydrolase [Glaciimonas sp. GG7]